MKKRYLLLTSLCFYSFLAFSSGIQDNFNFLNKLWYHTKKPADMDYTLSPFALVVDKDKALMYLYFYNGDTKLIKSYKVVTGKTPGIKEKLGDAKTPEGVYFFKQYWDHKRVFETLPEERARKIGAFAITTNYPNAIDAIENRNGHSIWLHGVETDDRVDKKRDTDGCVGTTNIDLENVSEFIETNTTPILIFDKFTDNPETYSLAPTSGIKDFLEKWRSSWSNKDINTYETCYDEKFYDETAQKNKKQWVEYKNILNQNYKYINVNLKNLSVYKHPRYWVAMFIQEYSAPGKSLRGLKKLYISENKPNEFGILAEEYVALSNIRYVPDLRR